jgi:hypothetical protein
MSDDQRRAPRVDAKRQLWCEGQSDKNAETRNISKGGMFIVAEQPREVGEQFKVSFEDEEGAIELNMEVMWRGEAAASGQTGMGLKIVGFNKGEGAYERFVARHLDAHNEGDGDNGDGDEAGDKK